MASKATPKTALKSKSLPNSVASMGTSSSDAADIKTGREINRKSIEAVPLRMVTPQLGRKRPSQMATPKLEYTTPQLGRKWPSQMATPKLENTTPQLGRKWPSQMATPKLENTTPMANSAKKNLWKRTPAHSGVPVPEKMKKLILKTKLENSKNL